MTYLEIVNAVLRRLRESETGFVDGTDLSKRTGDWVNQAKREVEDAWRWTALETELSLSVLTGVTSYRLLDFGQRAKIRKVNNATQRNRVLSQNWDRFTDNQDFGDVTGEPMHWRINGVEEGDMKIEIYPTPDAAYTLSIYATVPQADLTDDATVVTVPYWPVILGAYALAVAERGDDRGNNDQLVIAEYQSALNDAMAIDVHNNHAGMVSDWTIPGNWPAHSRGSWSTDW